MSKISAVEVLEWLSKNYLDIEVCKKTFGRNLTLNEIIKKEMSPYEIVDRIEKYEAEKNHIVDTNKKVEREFKVGDWVVNQFGTKRQIKFIDEDGYNVIDENGVVCYLDITKWKRTEPPKEEKQKIEKLNTYENFGCKPKKIDILNKINELVDAVNELRGAE